MKKLLAFFIMSFAAVCYGSPPSVKLVHSTTFSAPYDTLNQAAVEAVQESYRQSNHYEFGGLILFDTKTQKYVYQKPFTDLSIDSIFIEHNVKIDDPDYVVVSEFHTHPCYPYTHVPWDFSPNDVYNYMLRHQIGYMGNFCNGKVQKWDPHDITYLEELDGDGPFDIDVNSTYEGEVVGEISLNKKPDIQESIIDALKIYHDVK